MSDSISVRDVADQAEGLFAAVWRWVVLVAAIAAGTFLGLLLFAWFVANQAENEFKDLLNTRTPSRSSAHSVQPQAITIVAVPAVSGHRVLC